MCFSLVGGIHFWDSTFSTWFNKKCHENAACLVVVEPRTFFIPMTTRSGGSLSKSALKVWNKTDSHLTVDYTAVLHSLAQKSSFISSHQKLMKATQFDCTKKREHGQNYAGRRPKISWLRSRGWELPTATGMQITCSLPFVIIIFKNT